MTTYKRLRSEESGAVFVLFVLALFVLMAMAAFAVDLGWIFLNKSRAQRAAEAAALAGVTALPAEPTVAIDRAFEFARINGYDDADPNIVVTPTPTANNELRVQVDDDVDTFFMRVFGIDTVHIDVSARARFVGAVPLGNPDNIFGPQPGTPGQNFADLGFWPAITFQDDRKVNGDPFATRCYSSDCSVTNDEYYNGDGYWYAVEVLPGSTNLTVDIYDAGYGQAGQDADRDNFPVETSFSFFGAEPEQQRLSIIGSVADGTGTYLIDFGGETTDPIVLDADAGASGNNLRDALEALDNVGDVNIDSAMEAGGNYVFEFRVNNPSGHDFALVSCEDFGLAPSGAGVQQCFGTPMMDGSLDESPDTTFTLHAPDPTPFTFRDNDVITACDQTYGPELVAGTNYTWTELCAIASPTPGVYPLRITASGGRSWNSYSLRANVDSGGVRLYALEDLSLATRIRDGEQTFFLAEIAEDYRGLSFVVELFDPGDMFDEDGVEERSFVSIVGPDGNIWSGGCDIEVSRDPVGDPTDSYGPLESDPAGTNCTLETTRDAANPGYNGDWIRFVVPLPGDYECNTTGPDPFCWWSVFYDYDGTANERTTWRASVQGSRVALVFEPEP